MKGMFIPEITAEMFRKGCLESIEALMAEGEIYDIDYQQPCEDAVSRETVLDTLDKMDKALDTDRTVENYKELLTECYKDLPSVGKDINVTTTDCISRQAAHDSFWKLDIELRPSAIDAIVNMINNLPSVTPKEKTGKWIDEADNIDAQFDRHEYKCSVCGRIANYYVGGNECWWDIYKPNFCPNCGTRMIEPQES